MLCHVGLATTAAALLVLAVGPRVAARRVRAGTGAAILVRGLVPGRVGLELVHGVDVQDEHIALDVPGTPCGCQLLLSSCCMWSMERQQQTQQQVRVKTSRSTGLTTHLATCQTCQFHPQHPNSTGGGDKPAGLHQHHPDAWATHRRHPDQDPRACERFKPRQIAAAAGRFPRAST